MEIRREEEDFKALSRVVPNVEIDDIYMISCKFNRDTDVSPHESVNIRLSSSGELLSENKDRFQAKVYLCLVVNPEEEEIEITRIECEYVLSYFINPNSNLKSDDLQRFCKINAIYNIWPYYREFIDNMANRADLPLPRVPLIKIKASKRKKENLSEQESS